MTRRRLVVFSVFAQAASAQLTGDWTTTGFDAQRSFWARSDARISLDNMRKGGFELLWKTDLKGSATPPVLLDFYIGYRGFRALGFTGTSANSVVAMDTDLGRLEWKTDFKAPAGSSTGGCPGGMTSGVARPTNIAYPVAVIPRGTGRGTPATSGVGEPFEGAVTLKEMANRRAARPPAPPPPATGARRTTAPVNPFAPRVQWVYALASDGKLHALYVSNGEEPNDPISFLPPDAHAKGLLVVDDVAYVATTNGCGEAGNGIWALDLPSRKVARWKAPGNIAGSAGIALGPDGTIYAAAQNELVALEERTLKPKASYRIGNAAFTSSPIVFQFQGKDLIAAASNDGRLHLLDAGAMDSALAIIPMFSTPDLAVAAMASWEDASGTRWLLVPSRDAIVTWKVVSRNGAPAFEPGWVSRDMTAPLTPIVVRDVVFAVSSAGALYALDSANGREIWNSGHTLPGSIGAGGLAAGGGRVYVATEDGAQYVFGFPMER